MNQKAIFEIGNIIHIRYAYKFLIFNKTELTPKEITDTYEYKMFKEVNPELCRLAEK